METVLLTAGSSAPAFRRETAGGVLVLTPLIPLGSLSEPEINRETADLLQLINGNGAGPLNVLFDLAHSEYLGTAMLGALVRLWKRVSQRGGRLMMCNVSDGVREILRITKLHAVWPICATREQALAELGA